MKPKIVDLYQNKLSEEDHHLVQQIEAEADSTPARDKGLAIHVGAIEKLRAKGYSYREIAVWFGERKFKVSHVDVWRAHKNGLTREDLFGLADHDEEWESYINKKSEGAVTRYEDKFPENAPSAEDIKTKKKTKNKATERS